MNGIREISKVMRNGKLGVEFQKRAACVAEELLKLAWGQAALNPQQYSTGLKPLHVGFAMIGRRVRP
jgi:hypothetical protein